MDTKLFPKSSPFKSCSFNSFHISTSLFIKAREVLHACEGSKEGKNKKAVNCVQVKNRDLKETDKAFLVYEYETFISKSNDLSAS